MSPVTTVLSIVIPVGQNYQYYVQLKIVHTIIHDEWLIPQMEEVVQGLEVVEEARLPQERPQEREVSHRNKKYTLSLM